MIRSSEQVNEVFAAFAKAQLAFPEIPKNKTVVVKDREGKKLYDFDYADLVQIISHTRKPLADNGLSFTQTLGYLPEQGKGFLTRIMHASGQWFESGFIPATLYEKVGMKEIAAQTTYGKRLSLGEALGVAADDDVDAPSEDNESLDVKPKGAASTSKTKPASKPASRPEASKASKPAAAAAPAKTEWPYKWIKDMDEFSEGVPKFIEDFDSDQLCAADKRLTGWLASDQAGKAKAPFPQEGKFLLELLRDLMTKTTVERETQNDLDAALARSP